MKGLAWGVCAVLLFGGTLAAGPLEVTVGAGPGGAFLGEINASIGLINVILRDWNSTPTLTGGVPELDSMQVGMSYVAGEAFWVTPSLALGGKIETFQVVSSTAGSYTAGEEPSSQVEIGLDCHAVALVVGGHVDFVDFGLRLGLDLGAGYYYSGFKTDITFEIPSGVPPISAHPEKGKGQYSASSLGIEGGLSLFFPIAEWFAIGSSLAYRWVAVAPLADAQGEALDLDGNGTPESIDLTGIAVSFTVSLRIDLSPGEGERRTP
jgi:hypothetical protein